MPMLIGVVLTAIAYWPALDAGFYFDDLPNIVEAPGLHWTSLATADLEGLRSATVLPRRWLANLSFALNHVHGGLDPRGYHAVNVLIHIAVGLVLAWTAARIVGDAATTDGQRRRATSAAAAAALLFLVHPLNTQAVTYAVQRMTSLAALFAVAALGCWVSGRRDGHRSWPWLVAAATMWLLALGSKENAVAVPLVVLTWELCARRDEWRARLQDGRWRTGLLAGAVASVILVTWVGSAIVGPSTVSWTEPFANRDFGGLERVLTQPRVQLFYLSLLIWPAPSRLNLEHELVVSRSLFVPPATVVALLVCIGAAGIAIWLAARRPRLGFPIVAYFLLHLPESGPLGLDMVFEHRMYLPMTALVILLATGLAALLGTLPVHQHRFVLAATVALAVSLSVATRARNLTWADSIEFHKDCARKSPNKFRPQFNLGTLLGQTGRVAEALPVLERWVASCAGRRPRTAAPFSSIRTTPRRSTTWRVGWNAKDGCVRRPCTTATSPRSRRPCCAATRSARASALRPSTPSCRPP